LRLEKVSGVGFQVSGFRKGKFQGLNFELKPGFNHSGETQRRLEPETRYPKPDTFKKKKGFDANEHTSKP
jgi:hypothetical protein